MSKYLVIDYVLNFSFESDSKEELMESLGYEVDECSFEEFLSNVEGEYEITVIEEVNS
jgi:hypothetical protein